MEHNGAEFALTRTLQERRTSIAHGLRAHFSFATLLAILFLTFLDNTIVSVGEAPAPSAAVNASA